MENIKILYPSQYAKRALPEDMIMRFDLQGCTLSRALCIAMGLDKGDKINFAMEGNQVLLCKTTETDAVLLRGEISKGLQFSFKPLVQFILEHFKLYGILKDKTLSNVKFEVLKDVDESAGTWFKIVPPKPFQSPQKNTQNGKLQHA